jgi:hypothetical protein
VTTAAADPRHAWPETTDDQPDDTVPRSRGAEMLMHIATGAMAALVVSLLWIVGSPADLPTKLWSIVIGLSAIMAVCAFIGVTRAENTKTRALICRLAAAAGTQRGNILDLLSVHSAGNGSRRRRPSRSGRPGKVLQMPAPDQRDAWMLQAAADAYKLGKKVAGEEDDGPQPA